MKVHEKDPHAEIDSSLNPMDSLDEIDSLLEVWTVPTWASAKSQSLTPHMAVLHDQIHV